MGIAALSLLAACASDEPGASRPADAPIVAVVGDSITALSESQIHERLDDRYEIDVQAISGKTISEMTPAVRSAVDRGVDAIIVNLGTNDTVGETDYEADLAAVLAMVRPIGCVVMVTVNDGSGFDSRQDEIATRINAMIRRSGYLVWDWNVEAKKHPAWILSDAIHPTDLGRDVIAEEYGRSLDRCDL